MTLSPVGQVSAVSRWNPHSLGDIGLREIKGTGLAGRELPGDQCAKGANKAATGRCVFYNLARDVRLRPQRLPTRS